MRKICLKRRKTGLVLISTHGSANKEFLRIAINWYAYFTKPLATYIKKRVGHHQTNFFSQIVLLSAPATVLRTYTGEALSVLGEMKITIKSKNQSHKVMLLVVKKGGHQTRDPFVWIRDWTFIVVNCIGYTSTELLCLLAITTAADIAAFQTMWWHQSK